MLDMTVATGNVLDMTPFLTTGLFPPLAELDAYWHAKRPMGGLPSRADIDPRGIAGALAHSFVLERLEAEVFRLRLGGHVLNDLLGMEVRGMSPVALFAPPHQQDFIGLCETACTNPAILQADVSAQRGADRPSLEGRLALWPLLDDQGYASRLLGGISYRGAVGKTPRALQLVSHRLRTLDAVVAVPPTPAGAGQHDQVSATDPSGFAEPASVFAPAGATDQAQGAQSGQPQGKRYGHLRLVSQSEDGRGDQD